jgi:hypothetical protein
MLIEYVIQYRWNRKWKDTAWVGKHKTEAVRERDLLNTANGDSTVYRVIERKKVETVVK